MDEDSETVKPKIKAHLSSGEIRQFLHPSLNSEITNPGRLWIPGFFSEN
jgi:hypothetical protein